MVYDLMDDAPSTLISNIPARKEVKSPVLPFFTPENTFYVTDVVSPLKLWWDCEVEKKRRGEINEIDQNEIKAAFMGVINIWYHVMKKHPEHFIPLNIQKGIWNWDIIIQLKRNFQK